MRTPVETLIAQHKDIINAILRQDPEGAEAAMRIHLSEVLKITERLATEHPDLIINDV